MKIIILFAFSALAVGFVEANAARAGESSVKSDRTTYNRLMRKLGRVDRQYSENLRECADNKRVTGTKVDLKKKAELINVRDERDRLVQRIQIIALRHAWPSPSFTPPDAATAPPVSPSASVFKPADYIINGVFAAEAGRIAKALTGLPVVSLKATGKPRRVKG